MLNSRFFRNVTFFFSTSESNDSLKFAGAIVPEYQLWELKTKSLRRMNRRKLQNRKKKKRSYLWQSIPDIRRGM